MPGFSIGDGEGGPPNTTEARRTHRWVFTALDPENLGADQLLFLKSASRPKFVAEEAVMHHDQEQAYFLGKHTWDPITMTWYDIQQDPDISESLYNWLNAAVTIAGAVAQLPSDYKKEAKLDMISNTGDAEETWAIKGAWPKEVDWGSLDYTSTEIQECSAVLRFDRAIREL